MEIEISQIKDGALFKKILLQPDVLQYFPMYDVREIDDSVRIWEIFCRKGASLTAIEGSKPCGMAFLNLQGYKKFAHQCLITILVDEEHRNKGIGTKLLEELFKLAKTPFEMEMLHLEVYEGNPAIHLYQRMGFSEYGTQQMFIKEDSRYIAKILMEKDI
ncbi:MAG: GNAT family N-acetyltransferase [Simkaniaceae bacterium]|nr:GNAT family N-acetyltransferase [Candidatus Sacchlamyda saccharinae]